MIDVTCAIIRNEEDEILIVQRGESTDHPFKWEFPGGKIHPGETREDCIIREIREELSIDIVIVSLLPDVEHDYGFKQIRLIPFICDTLDELPLLSEHVAYRWIRPAGLADVGFCEADMIVAAEYLESNSVPVEISTVKEPVNGDNLTDDSELQTAVYRMMSMKEAEWFAESAIENPVIFNKLLDYSYSDDQKLAFRASWTLTKVCDKFPEMIHPHLEDIVSKLDSISSESTVRSFLRIISLTEMDKIAGRSQGLLADYCFRALRSGFTAIAVKAYAMEILYKLALIYPELSNELAATINLIQVDASAGILSRGRQILRKLSGNT